MIPSLDARGLLPTGRHRAPLEQVPPRFCTNDYRWQLWDLALDGLSELCHDWVKRPGCEAPNLIIGGSFFSDKARPSDIEATLFYPQQMPDDQCWRILLDWQRSKDLIKQRYRLDFYPTLPGGNDFASFFQYVGPKTAQSKGLGEKDARGVIEVLNW